MINKVMLMGYLGRDPEARFTAGGARYVKFTLGSTRTWKDEIGKDQKETEWSNILVWNGRAEACLKYLSKGRLVFVEGYLKTERWNADGIDQRRTYIVATDIKFIPTSKGRNHQNDAETEEQEQPL